MAEKVRIRFSPGDETVNVDKGMDLLDAAIEADVYIDSICGGRGKCGKCRVIVKAGEVSTEETELLTPEDIEKGYRLACMTRAQGDVKVLVPEESRAGLHQILTKAEVMEAEELDPPVMKFHFELGEPTLTDNLSDLDRLKRSLSDHGICDIMGHIPVMRRMSDLFRSSKWDVTATIVEEGECYELVHLEAGDTSGRNFGLAVDVGTTTVVAELVNLSTGEIVAKKAAYNKQVIHGEDVLTRILYAEEEKGGLQDLRRLIVETINYLLEEMLKEAKAGRNEICYAATAGNTVMTHLLLGLNPAYIRREPYIPTANFFPLIKAREVGLKINPEGYVYILPCRSSYVGGDITADVLASALHKTDKLSMLMDVGTNGEVVLGNRDWMVSCSCSAGPAFEGGEVDYGIRATVGAIEKAALTTDLDVKYSTIGNVRPKGICGTGLIDLLAELFTHGVIDRSGRIRPLDTPRIRDGPEGKEFVVVWADETKIKKDMVITEVDIRNIIRTKAAVYAAATVLLKTMNYSFEDLEQIFIAGGFGNYLDTRKSVWLGLLPDVNPEKFRFIGNGSLAGARLTMMSKKSKQQAIDIAKKMTYIELSVTPMFFNEFTSAMFLPHTDIEKFPSAKELVI
ncbi:MAG: ASKHA domain-containing protein [Thermoplasmata archaeon]